MFNLALLSLVIPIIALAFESYPRFLNRKFGVDIWTHLLYLKEYHKKKGIPKKIENGFIIAGDYDYPPIFIKILSKFPVRIVEKFEFLFSPIFDSIHLVLIFLISYYLTQNLFISILTQVLYLLTPIIVLENASATPRSLGYTLFTVFMFSIFFFLQSGQTYLLLLSLISGSLIFLSHRFTTQSLFFFSIFFAVLDKNLIYLFLFILSLILAVIISKGFYLKVLRGHLGNLNFWHKNIDYRFAHQIKGNYSEYKTKDFIFKLYNQFLKFPPFVLTITNPWTLPPLYIFFFSEIQVGIVYKMLWIVIFSYFLAVITTWVPRLRFLGEGQRYLELSAFPAAFISALLLNDYLKASFPNFLMFGYILVGASALLTILVIQRKGIIKDNLRTVTPSMEKMFSYLKPLTKKPRLLCIPHQITTSTIYHTGCPVFVNASYKTIDKISDVYPYFKRPVAEIMVKYKLDMILLNEDYASVDDLNLGKHKIVKKTDNFSLIKLL